MLVFTPVTSLTLALPALNETPPLEENAGNPLDNLTLLSRSNAGMADEADPVPRPVADDALMNVFTHHSHEK